MIHPPTLGPWALGSKIKLNTEASKVSSGPGTIQEVWRKVAFGGLTSACGFQIQGNYPLLGRWECAGCCDLWSQLPLQPKKPIMLCQQGWEPKPPAQGPLIMLESSGNQVAGFQSFCHP